RKRIGRRGSVVKPLNNELIETNKNRVDINTLTNSFLVRPRSLSIRNLQKEIEQSYQNEWIYIQLPNRTFKKTTQIEFQNQKNLNKNEENSTKYYPKELNSIIFANKLNKIFNLISIKFQGFLSGIAFSHALFILYFLPELNENLLKYYGQLNILIQIFFYIFLSIIVVDALDWFVSLNFNNWWSSIKNSLLSCQTISAICWVLSYFASLLSTHFDEQFALNNSNLLEK
ncbi:hypothetical protein Mgra_00004652, partial [Meloidogyne graminicola]